MTIKERKRRWLANEIDCVEEGMVIRSLPRRPRFLGNHSPHGRGYRLDPMTGRPAAGPVSALMALCMAETSPCNG